MLTYLEPMLVSWKLFLIEPESARLGIARPEFKFLPTHETHLGDYGPNSLKLTSTSPSCYEDKKGDLCSLDEGWHKNEVAVIKL